MNVWFSFRGLYSFGQATAVVFSQPIFPFEKVGDGLGLDAYFHAAQAGEQKVHLPHKSGLAALGLAARLDGHADLAAFTLQQSPFFRNFMRGEQTLRHEIEALAAHGQVGVLAKRFITVGEKIGAGDLALHHHGAGLPFPGDHVGRFAAGTGLLRKHDAATVSATKPLLGQTDKLLMGHA